MDALILKELTDIKFATNRMVEHIDFVERHIGWVQNLIVTFLPSISRFFSPSAKERPNTPNFDDIV